MKRIGKMCVVIMIFCSLVQVVPSYADDCVVGGIIVNLANCSISELPSKILKKAIEGAINGFMTGAAGGIIDWLGNKPEAHNKENFDFERIEKSIGRIEEKMHEMRGILCGLE